MTTSPDLPKLFRAMIRGDESTANEVEARLDVVGWGNLPRFLMSLCYIAVDRKFPNGAKRAEIIDFVAHVRTNVPDIDAVLAETLVASYLDPDVDYSMSQEMISMIQTAIVCQVFIDEGISDADLDAVLAEAVEFAEGE